MPMTTNGQTVSITATGNHVVTAVNLGICQYGLTVAASEDPIIGEYDLPSGEPIAGSRLAGVDEDVLGELAPNSGWVQADSSVLRNWNAPPSAGCELRVSLIDG